MPTLPPEKILKEFAPELMAGVDPLNDMAALLADRVSRPDEVIAPAPVKALELNSKPVLEKLYSSAPLTARFRVLPVKTFKERSPVLSEYMATSVELGAPVVPLNNILDKSFKSHPSASISEVQGVRPPPSSVPHLKIPPTVSRAVQVVYWESVNLKMLEKVAVAPIPTLPEVLSPAKEVNPVTDNDELNTPAEVTVKD